MVELGARLRTSYDVCASIRRGARAGLGGAESTGAKVTGVGAGVGVWLGRLGIRDLVYCRVRTGAEGRRRDGDKVG